MTLPDDQSVLAQAATELPRITCGDDLRGLSTDQLMLAFRAGTAPTTVRVVDGDPAGIPLAPAMLTGGWFERRLRRAALGERFIWHGKGFRSYSDQAGWGYNRLNRGPVLHGFPFRTFIGPSRLDDSSSLILDFDVPKNPPGERRTWDELRMVAPDVYLGISGARCFGRYIRIAWFAVDASRQVPVIGA